MASYRPGTEADKWLNEVWAREIDVLAYEEQVFISNISESDRLFKKLHIPLHANLSRASLANSDTGSSLTFVANTESEVTVTPGATVVPVEVSAHTISRMQNDPDDMLKRSIEMSLAEGVDVAGLALVSALTTNIVGSGATNLTKSDILDGLQKLAAGAKMYFKPGKTDAICIVHANQVDDILSISDITNAQFRGDSANPGVSGWVAKAFGCKFYETGNVATSGGTAYNVMFIPRAFTISYNQRPTVKSEDFQLTKRIIGWTDYGVATVRDQYAVQLLSSSAA